jgi:DNA modification methylase
MCEGKIDLRCCDNLELMATIPDNTIDLIYCDILYGTGRNFGEYQDLPPKRSIIEKHYLIRLKEMHRILKENGSIYLQMDTSINHWVRCLMDDIFGYNNFQNEIVWCYRSQGYSKTRWSKKHDVILFYSVGENFKFNLDDVRLSELSETTRKRWYKEIEKSGKIPTKKNGKIYWSNPYSPPLDWLDIRALPQAHPERNGYPTQKPTELISNLILASTDKGDLVADFYAGSFTTAVVCKELGRNFIGCDINPNAYEIGKERVEDFKKMPLQKSIFETEQ